MKNFLMLLFLLFMIVAIPDAAGQNTKPAEAMRLFDAGNFEAAEKAFGQLVAKDSSNTLFLYYYGASRTENGHFSHKDLNILLKAGKEVTPHRINYYLGMQHHAAENWEEALKHYNQFRGSVPEKEQEEVRLIQKIQQCFDRINPYKEGAVETPGEIADHQSRAPVPKQEVPIQSNEKPRETGKSTDAMPAAPEEEPQAVVLAEKDRLVVAAAPPQEEKRRITLPPRKNLPDLPGVQPTFQPPEGDSIHFQINSNITYLNTAHFKTSRGKELFLQGQQLQKNLKKIQESINELREKYHSADNQEEKASIGKDILALEKESYQIKNETTQLFSDSRKKENQYWQNAGAIRRQNFIVELNKIRAAQQQKKKARSTEEVTIAEDAWLLPSSDLLGMSAAKAKADSEASRNPLVYKIQIGAYSKELPAYIQRLYDKLSLIREIEHYTDEKGVVVYTTGNLTILEDAKKMKNQVQQEGIEDAFVVPYFRGKRITLEQAKKIEQRNVIQRD